MSLSSYAPLAEKVFIRSGDRFFTVFRKMLGRLFDTDATALASSPCARGNADDADAVGAPPALAADDLHLVLRLWAGDLQRPKKRGRPTLYTQAQRLVDDPLVLAMCRAVCLHLAWTSVMEECCERQGYAEESSWWNEDDNALRIEMWEARGATMSTYEDSLDAMATAVESGSINDFLEALESFNEELDCP